MSISTEISRIQTATGDIKTAITGKGVTVPEGSQIDDLSALITSIPTGGGGLAVTELWDTGNTTLYGSYACTSAFLVIDCTNFDTLTFNYDFNQTSTTGYQVTGSIRVNLGYTMGITNTGANIGTTIVVDSTPSQPYALYSNGSSVTNGSYTIDTTNYTTVTLQVGRYKYTPSDTRNQTIYSAVRLYNIEGV